MKTKNIKYTFLALFFCVASQNFTSAQCSRTDRGCWFTEAITSIENEDFKNAKKYLKKAKNTKNGIAEAKKMWDAKRLSKYYEPLANFKNQFKTKHGSRYFKESLSVLNSGLNLAERNKNASTDSTQELDENIHDFFETTIPVVEEERSQAVEDAATEANTNFAENNYQSALSKYEFVFREADDSNPSKLEASKRINECKYYIAITSAEKMYDNKKCEKAFDFALEALQYDSTSSDAMVIRDDAADCAYKKIAITAEDQRSSGKCEEAIKTYERGRKYYEIVQNETDLESPEEGISSAKNCAALAYLEKAKDFYKTDNHKSAITALKKAKYFSPGQDIKFEGEFENESTYNAITLEEKFFDDLVENGENAYEEGMDDLSKYNGAIKSFKGAAVYRDSMSMYDKIAYVKAVKVAQKLENNKEHLTTAAEQQELVDAWYKAKRLASAANLAGGINARTKYEEVNNLHTSTLGKERFAAKSSETNIKLMPIESKFTIDVPRRGEDDANFGGGAIVTVSYDLRVNANSPDILQAKFYINLLEERGHFGGNTNTNFNVTEEVNILKLPARYSEEFKISGFGSKWRPGGSFSYEGKVLNNRLIKGPPRRMDLTSDASFINDAALIFEGGRVTFSFEPYPAEVDVERETNSSTYDTGTIISASPALANYNQIEINQTYHLESAIAQKYLDVQWAKDADGTPLHLWPFNGAEAQRFTLEDAGSDYYYIKSALGKYVHVQNGSANPEALALIWEGKGNDNTKWKFEDAGDGYHYIRSKKGTYLDVKGGSDKDGTLIWLWTPNQGAAQKWKLVKAD